MITLRGILRDPFEPEVVQHTPNLSNLPEEDNVAMDPDISIGPWQTGQTGGSASAFPGMGIETHGTDTDAKTHWLQKTIDHKFTS